MAPSSGGRLMIALLVGAVLGAAGCYSIKQETLTQTVRVTTRPGNAYVWTQDAAGKQDVGQAPVQVKRTYQVTRQRFRHWNWVWPALFTAITGAGVGVFVNEQGAESPSVGTKAGGIVMMTVGGTLLLTTLPLTIAMAVRGNRDVTTSQPLTIGASAPGHADRWASLAVPSQQRSLHISLPPAGEPAGPVRLLGTAPLGGVVMRRPARAVPIVAVFNVQDASKRLDPDLLDQLTEYLATQLAATARYRIVPRDRLRERLVDERRKSYRACYDEACQIELGKAVAAQKSLSTRLLRVGERCAITAALFDLRTETTEAAASADTTCSVEALLGAMREVVKQLGK